MNPHLPWVQKQEPLQLWEEYKPKPCKFQWGKKGSSQDYLRQPENNVTKINQQVVETRIEAKK